MQTHERLLIVQRRLTHYRLPFFERLRERLAHDGVQLSLAVGQATPAEAQKHDGGTLAWAVDAPCRYLLNGRLCWQDLGRALAQADRVVITQENKLLNNLALLGGARRRPVALWGHGGNLQARPGLASRAAQGFKAHMSRRAQWWFAYTELSAQLFQGMQIAPERITVVNNAVDTQQLRSEVLALSQRSPAALRHEAGLPEGPLAVFIGSLYADKRLDLLLAAATLLHQQLPGFQLAIAGAGPLLESLRAQTAHSPWVHVLGPLQGTHKACLLATADLMLNPGLVGLGILDAFAAGLPLLTTDCGVHSPEIAYLQPGVNGLMCPPQAQALAEAALRLWHEPILAERLRQGSAAAASLYGLDQMVERFAAGVCQWRSQPAGAPS
jgi:L-malate glycosyltransferase